MNRSDFQRLTRARLRDASVLLSNRRFSAAYYVVGYAVECALKACVAKKTKRYEFPDRRAADLYIHNLARLVGHAELDEDLQSSAAADAVLQKSWGTVKDWNEEARYKIASEKQARDMCAAAEYVLAWIQSKW